MIFSQAIHEAMRPDMFKRQSVLKHRKTTGNLALIAWQNGVKMIPAGSDCTVRGLQTRSIARGILAALLACLLCGNAAMADPSQIKLRDDFEGDTFSPTGGLFYKDNVEQRAGTHRTQGDVFRSGKKGLALSVVPHCKPDQRGCSERAEVWEKPELLAGYDKTLWYGLAMKLDDSPPSASHRFVVAQWKREIHPGADGDYSPFLAIRIIRGDYAITIDSDAISSRATDAQDQPLSCANGAARAMQRAQAKQTRMVVAMSAGALPGNFAGFDSCAPGVTVIARGGQLPKAESRWIDFVIKVKPGPDGDGEIELFADDAWIVTVRGRIGHQGPGLGANQYFKFGPYRDGGLKTNWQVFYDDFRRGPRCEDVAGPAVCDQVRAK
jgi:hypothetical protein